MAITPGGVIIGEEIFAPVGVDAGGFVTCFSISDDGLTKVISTDVFNSYIWGQGDTQWRMAFTPDTLQSSEYDPFPAATIDVRGGCGIAVAPTDKTYIVGAWDGFFYFSTNTGAAFTRGALAAKRMYANTGAQRLWNDRVCVSPANKNHALLGTTNDGVYYTKDFGTTITAVNGTIPANATYGGSETPYLVAIAANGTTCYIMVQGTGVYRSTTGVDGTFTAMSGSPTLASCMIVDAADNLWVCDPAYAGLRKCVGTTWSNKAITTSTVPISVAVDPSDTNNMAMSGGDSGTFFQSRDGGATQFEGQWFNNYPVTNALYMDATGDVPWLTGHPMFPSCLKFNPAVPGELWQSHGLGVCYSTPPATYTQWLWASRSAGIRELVCNNFLSVEGYDIISNFWDQGSWQSPVNASAVNVYPKYANSPYVDLENVWQSDFASDDPSYIVDMRNLTGGAGGNCCGLSTDGGATVELLFPGGYPTGGATIGGACAVGIKAEQILVPANNGRAICTDDQWVSWDYLPIDPDIAGAGNWINAQFIRRNLVTADKTRSGVFAIIMNGDNQGANKQGLWVTTTGPLGSWSRKAVGPLDPTGDPGDYWDCTLSYIPGKSGELLYTTGPAFDSQLMWFTSDGASGSGTALGSTWSVTKVDVFGFGMSLTGQSYPAVFFYGETSGVKGLYASYDFFATEPLLLDRWPAGNLDEVSAISGDMNIFGRVYIGYNGSGAVYGDYADTRRQT